MREDARRSSGRGWGGRWRGRGAPALRRQGDGAPCRPPGACWRVVKGVGGVLWFLLLGGCLAGNTASRPAAPPPIPERLALPAPQPAPEPPAEGTILRLDRADLYRDHRARQVGDILLVKIVETASGSKKASTKSKRESKLSGGIASLFGFETWLKNHNANFTPSTSSLNTSFKNEFDGSGETKNDSTVTATLSARVIEVTPQGNLVIRGIREIRLNNETQHLILSGLVRPDDIGPDNSVLSTHIADARIEYAGTGTVSDRQRPGWLARGLDLIWPF